MFDYAKCIEKLCEFIVQRRKVGNLTALSKGNKKVYLTIKYKDS